MEGGYFEVARNPKFFFFGMNENENILKRQHLRLRMVGRRFRSYFVGSDTSVWAEALGWVAGVALESEGYTKAIGYPNDPNFAATVFDFDLNRFIRAKYSTK